MKLLPIICPYIIQQTGNENIQTYQLEVVILIQHQIHVTALQQNVWQLDTCMFCLSNCIIGWLQRPRKNNNNDIVNFKIK